MKPAEPKTTMVQLRQAVPEDFADLLILFRQLWPTKPISEGPLREVYLRVIAAPGRQYFCAVMGNRVIGLGSVTIKDNLWQEGRIAYIEEIVVHEDLQGKSIGTQLLERLILSAKEAGCRRVELDSAFHRKQAHLFYERHGFENRAYLFSKVL
jgi:GNAT superfamily N-acetyltransferase